MTSDIALRLAADLLWTALLVGGPIMLLTLLVGLAVSVLQVVTQVQEMSLTIVPKLLAAGVVVLAFGPWMLRVLCRFAVGLWSQIPSMF